MSKHEQSQKGRQFIATFVLHKTQTAGAICDGEKELKQVNSNYYNVN